MDPRQKWRDGSTRLGARSIVWLARLLPAAIVAAALGFLYRAPLQGRVYWFEDIRDYFHPLWTAAARAMRAGRWPSWELGAWSGLPLLRDPQVGVFYPPNWLWLAIDPLRVYAWLALAHAALAAAGMAALLRARGRSREAAALGALALGGSAFMVLELRHSMFGATTAWLPWLLWAAERYGQTERPRYRVAFAAALALALAAGGWSMLIFFAPVAAVLVLSSVRRPGARLALAAAAAVGLGLAAVALVPALAHVPYSPRALGLTYHEATTFAWPSWRYAITLLLPTWFGDVARGTYTGAADQWELCGYAVGALTALLAPWSLLERRRRGERLLLLIGVAGALLYARGADGWLFPALYRGVPGFGQLRCPARALYIWTLVVPILGADGLDALLARASSARLRTLLGNLAVAALALELVITFRAENPSVALAATRVRPQAVDWLRAHGQGRFTNDVHLEHRLHHAGLLWDLDGASGYSSLPIWRYLHYLWIANHQAVYPHAQLADDLTAQGLWRFSSPLVDLLSVRWVLAPHDRPPDGSGFRRMFVGKDGIDVWQNDQAAPSAFVVYRTLIAPGDGAAARALADPHFAPAASAVVAAPIDGVPALGPGEAAPPATAATFVRQGPRAVDMHVEARAPGVLVVSEPWYPGWQVTVDGRPAPLLRVDYALRGVALPAGAHHVHMAFEDLPLRRGMLVSCIAFLCLGALGRRKKPMHKKRGPGELAAGASPTT